MHILILKAVPLQLIWDLCYDVHPSKFPMPLIHQEQQQLFRKKKRKHTFSVEVNDTKNWTSNIYFFNLIYYWEIKNNAPLHRIGNRGSGKGESTSYRAKTVMRLETQSRYIHSDYKALHIIFHQHKQVQMTVQPREIDKFISPNKSTCSLLNKNKMIKKKKEMRTQSKFIKK